MAGLFLLFGMSCKKDDLSTKTLDYSFYDDQYDGPNPGSIISTEHFETIEYDPDPELNDTTYSAYVFVNVDESNFTNASPGYSLSLDIYEPIYTYPDPPSDFVFAVPSSGPTYTQNYCKTLFFYDNQLELIRGYDMCYTVEY